MGLVVDEIVDIVEDRLDIQVTSDRVGILGSAVIKGQATEIIDVGHFLPLAFGNTTGFALANMSIYLLMAVTLIWRPLGIFGKSR